MGRFRLLVLSIFLNVYIVVCLLVFHWKFHLLGYFLNERRGGAPRSNSTATNEIADQARDPASRTVHQPKTARSASLEFRRDDRGYWFPSFDSLNSDLGKIRSQLFDKPQPRRQQQERSRRLLGFIRISKTGSTSLLRFMTLSTHSKRYTSYLNMDRYLTRAPDRTVPNCIYVSNDAPEKHVPSIGQCGHMPYPRFISGFTGTLQHLDETETAIGTANSTAVPEPIHLSLSVVCMLRDPFDRLLSFFHFFRQIYPGWEPMHQKNPQVLAALVGGDFPGFVRELSLLPATLTSRRFQFEHFSPNVEDAIDLVREGRFLPLFTECFDASLLLLVHHHPTFFPGRQPRATTEFLASPASRSRQTAKNRTELKEGLQPVQDFDVELFRRQAMDEYLVDEYLFIEEAKRSFVRRLQDAAMVRPAIMDQSILQGCLKRLQFQPDPAWPWQFH